MDAHTRPRAAATAARGSQRAHCPGTTLISDREQIWVLGSPQFVVICCGSHRKLWARTPSQTGKEKQPRVTQEEEITWLVPSSSDLSYSSGSPPSKNGQGQTVSPGPSSPARLLSLPCGPAPPPPARASWAWVPSGLTGLAPGPPAVEVDIAGPGEMLGTDLQEAPPPHRHRPLELGGVASPGSAQGLSGSAPSSQCPGTLAGSPDSPVPQCPPWERGRRRAVPYRGRPLRWGLACSQPTGGRLFCTRSRKRRSRPGALPRGPRAW